MAMPDGGRRTIPSQAGDAVLWGGLVAFIIASTMNGFALDVRVLGREITLRPDHAVLLAFGPCLGVLTLMRRFSWRLCWFDWVVAVFLLSNFAASVLVSTSRGASLQGSVLLAAYASMYFVVRQVLRDRADWLDALVKLILVLGALQALYVMVALSVFALGHNIGGLQIGHLSADSVVVAGTFWEANLLGAYFAVTGIFFIVRYLFGPVGNRANWYLLGVLLATLALPLTTTRAAALAFGLSLVGLAVAVAVSRRRPPKLANRTVRLVLTLACAGLLTVTAMNTLVSAVSRYPDLLLERWLPASVRPVCSNTNVGESRMGRAAARANEAARGKSVVGTRAEAGGVARASQGSVVGRRLAWSAALELWRDRPWFGHGTLAGGGAIQDGWWYSSLVQALYDTGLVGFLSLLAIHLCGVIYPIHAWRRSRSSLSPNLLGFGIGNAVLVVTSQFSNAFFVGLPWVLLGLSIGAAEALRNEAFKAQPHPERARR